MYWIRKEKLSDVNLVNDFNELIEVMFDDTLNEFQYIVAENDWRIVKK